MTIGDIIFATAVRRESTQSTETITEIMSPMNDRDRYILGRLIKMWHLTYSELQTSDEQIKTIMTLFVLGFEVGMIYQKGLD